VKLATSPLFITIALIGALIAAIVIVAKRTDGWKTTWHNAMEYIKLSFEQCSFWLAKKMLQIEDNFKTGFENIKIGWFMLQSLWDKDTAHEGLAKIQADRDARAQKIAEAQGKIDELAAARKAIDVWQVKWKPRGEKEEKPGLMDALTEAVKPVKGGSSGELGKTLGKSTAATATGGTRNTTVNINLGKMVESIVFNGGFNENEQDMEQRLAAMLSRILGMAEATAG
jgi:hypothetical protein